MKKVLFVVHGRLERNTQWLRIWKYIREQQEWKGAKVYTQRVGHAITLVVDGLKKERYDAVVACGGDGTLNECVNGIVQSNSSVPLGMLSLGTGNDFVKSLGLSGCWEEVQAALNNLSVVPCDVMRLETPTGLRFGINVSDIGIGGEVVQRISKDNRWLGSFLTYQKNIVKSFLSFKSINVEVSIDHSPAITERIFMLAACNASWFGSGLCIDPEAQINDGQLNLVVVEDISLMDYLKQLPSLRRGKRMNHRSVTYLKGERVSIQTPGYPIDCDGEFIGFTPLNIDLLRQAVNILVPETVALKP